MRNISFIITVCLLVACSDSTTELGNNYFLRIEGRTANEIINRKPNQRGIPPDILRYNYDDDFIIAEQRPNKFDDVMHNDKIKYEKGRESLYYWIIIKDKDELIGPLDISKFQEAKKEYDIPIDLELKSIY